MSKCLECTGKEIDMQHYKEKWLASEARVAELYRLISDDAFAITFQTLGQYRSALLEALRG